MFVNKTVLEVVKEEKRFTLQMDAGVNLLQIVDALTTMRQDVLSTLEKSLKQQDEEVAKLKEQADDKKEESKEESNG
jgi:Tfp pilus assembly protein PilN